MQRKCRNGEIKSFKKSLLDRDICEPIFFLNSAMYEGINKTSARATRGCTRVRCWIMPLPSGNTSLIRKEWPVGGSLTIGNAPPLKCKHFKDHLSFYSLLYQRKRAGVMCNLLCKSCAFHEIIQQIFSCGAEVVSNFMSQRVSSSLSMQA